MKRREEVCDRNSPLLTLQRKLASAQTEIPINEDNFPVVSGLFDAYRSSIIAPDHLLTGLTRNVIELLFKVLSPLNRRKADICICSALAENGLMRERSIYNETKLQLHSTSLSSVYCILLVSEHVMTKFVQEDHVIGNEVLDLMKQLKDLVAMTQWKPSMECDGKEACDLLSLEGGRPYFATLQAMAARYVTAVDDFWKRHPSDGDKLDKPNLHRFLELYNHTLPAFGHVSLVQELVFETAHQPLKRCISRGNHRNVEVSAVEQCLGNDWQARLILLQNGMKNSRQQAIAGLRRLLLGTETGELNDTEEKEVLEEVDRRIENLFIPPIMHILKSNGNVNPGLIRLPPRWTVCTGQKPSNNIIMENGYWDMDKLVERGRTIMTVHMGTFKQTSGQLLPKWKAQRVSPPNLACPSIAKPTDVVECGSIVQAITTKGKEQRTIVRPHGGGNCSISLFLAIAFLQGCDGELWAVAIRCSTDNAGIMHIPVTVEAKKTQLLLMSNGVRRVGVYHDCDFKSSCRIDVDLRKVIHGERIFGGGKFRIQVRKEGYPPRMA